MTAQGDGQVLDAEQVRLEFLDTELDGSLGRVVRGEGGDAVLFAGDTAHVDDEVGVLEVLLERRFPLLEGLLVPFVSELRGEDRLPGVPLFILEVVHEGVDGAEGMVFDADGFLGVVVITVRTEGLHDAELVADAGIHESVDGVVVEEVADDILHDLEVGQGDGQGTVGVEDFPGDRVAEVGHALGRNEVRLVAEELDAFRFQVFHGLFLLFIHNR